VVLPERLLRLLFFGTFNTLAMSSVMPVLMALGRSLCLHLDKVGAGMAAQDFWGGESDKQEV
jgi:hypothetical protein